MKKTLLAFVATSLIPLSLSARTLMCEQCEAEPPPCCDEHLFVERSQIFVHGEFLYWTVDTGLLEYAVEPNTTTTATNTLAIGDYRTAEYDWCPGFRVAASYYRCPRYWEVTGQYTWFRDSGSSSTTFPVNPTVVTATAAPFAMAASSVDFDYNLGDLYVARVFDPNPHLRMRLYGGATGGYFRHKQNTSYLNTQGNFDALETKWDYSAGGIRIGVTIDWFWGCQFYFTGRVSFATLVGRYENDFTQVNGTTGALIADARLKDTRLAFNPQFLLGPSWQMPCDCWSMEIFAGYELNMWFNLHERITTSFSAQDENKPTFVANNAIGIHGLTVRLTVGF